MELAEDHCGEPEQAAKAAGVRANVFASDNFTKYPKAADLLEAMIEERIRQAPSRPTRR